MNLKRSATELRGRGFPGRPGGHRKIGFSWANPTYFAIWVIYLMINIDLVSGAISYGIMDYLQRSKCHEQTALSFHLYWRLGLQNPWLISQVWISNMSRSSNMQSTRSIITIPVAWVLKNYTGMFTIWCFTNMWESSVPALWPQRLAIWGKWQRQLKLLRGVCFWKGLNMGGS